jgi:hypothetical protein
MTCELIPDLAGDGALPKTNSQARKCRDAIDEKLPAWVRDTVLPAINKHVADSGVDVKVTAEGMNIYIDYDSLATGHRLCPAPRQNRVRRPINRRQITCVAAAYLPDLEFPSAKARVMLPKRTFWEKATAVHAFCKQSAQGDRLSRHLHDLVHLDDAGYADAASDDRALAKGIADFKAKFFREKERQGNPIDHTEAVSGALQLVPDAETLKALEADYKKMADYGILLDDAEPFADLMKRCADME